MDSPNTFGSLLKDRRIRAGLTLRECSLKHGSDPSNWSKLERSITPAPKQEILEKWAVLFGLSLDETQDFLDLADISRRDIPRDIIASDAVVLEALPVFFRAARGAEMDDDKMKKFIAQVRKLHSPD